MSTNKSRREILQQLEADYSSAVANLESHDCMVKRLCDATRTAFDSWDEYKKHIDVHAILVRKWLDARDAWDAEKPKKKKRREFDDALA